MNEAKLFSLRWKNSDSVINNFVFRNPKFFSESKFKKGRHMRMKSPREQNPFDKRCMKRLDKTNYLFHSEKQYVKIIQVSIFYHHTGYFTK